MRVLKFTRTDDMIIYLNPDKISEIRQNSSKANTYVVFDGGVETIKESVDVAVGMWIKEFANGVIVPP